MAQSSPPLPKRTQPFFKSLYWKSPRTLGFMVLVMGAVAIGVKTWGTPQNGPAPKQAILPVTTLSLQPSTSYEIQRTYAGEVWANRTSELGFELTGTLIEIAVDEGDWVQQGMPLARLDTRSLAAQRQQLLAQKAQAQAQFRELKTGPRTEEIGAARAAVEDLGQQRLLAEQQSKRRQALYEQGAISREAFEERYFAAQALKKRQGQARKRLEELLAGTRVEQVESQSAQLAEIDARLKALDIQRSKSVLRAPFTGQVAQRLVDEGVVLNGGQPILRLVETSKIEARIGIPQAMASRMQPGQTYPVQVGDRRYKGQVKTLLPEVDNQSRTVMAVLTLPSDAAVSMGQTAKLALSQRQTQSGFWLPSTAVIAGERGLWSAYVLKSTDQDQVFSVARRDLEVLHTAGDRIYVRGMLNSQEQVIAKGTHRLAPGQLVRIANAKN